MSERKNNMMMKKIQYNIIVTTALLIIGMPCSVMAQTIRGNVYGGGEMAQVDGNTNVTINRGSLGADVFGGGEGKLNNDGTVSMSADVSGDTHVNINGGEFMVAYDGPDFKEHYNIYGGGNIASQVGVTHVYVTKGMVSNGSAGGDDFLDNDNADGIAKAYYNEGQMYFCIFGGGYGKNTSVTGDTWVDFNITGMTDINSTAIEDDLLEYQSYLDVIGGGFNGTVKGNTNVHVGGNAMCRDVYGGGLYAAIGTLDDAEKGKTNVHITGGNIDDVYGGGVMGDILTSTNVNIGLHNALSFDGRDYAVDNSKITILMSVFGGNDVSGRVEKANINHYGGTVNQDIYGAGNGNYRGYYTPDVCDYADGDNDNYYPVDHSGDTSTDGKGTTGPKGNTYKGRPQTGEVHITIAGNSTTDKAAVLGQVFGGGNSCTVGNWVTDLSSKYDGDPHKWRDDPAYFLGGGSLKVTVGSHVKIGRSRKELVEAGDEEYLNKEGENVSGLFMGCSGKYLATQDTAEDDYVYHHYYDRYTAKYWPGFAVFADDGTPLSREDGLASYNAYLNNILVWSDDVSLTIADDAEDIWLANFVGGGFRGSMKAKTAEGRFAYTLPEGVTIGNAVVGGAYNTDVVYRVFDTEDDMHTYKTTTIDGKTHYLYRTTLKPEWTQGTDYHHVEYAEDGETITGIVRFYYDGGMLSHDNSNARIHQVHADPRANDAEYATAYFEPLTTGDEAEDETTKAKLFTSNRDKAFVYLNLRCALEPEVLSDGESNHSVHGGNVFGGCFMSGLVQGDSWVDYGAWLSPNSTEPYYFDKTNNMHIYNEAADLVRNNALNVFGAGYGENTHTAGDTYLYIKAVAQVAGGDGDKNGKFPYMFNAFGGSYAGRVYGNTNVYYASGKQGTLLGSLYGGGFKGDIDGNTFVELAEGFVTNVYGGSRQANIGGAAHVWAYDGASRGIANANHLIICNLYGGNDIAGTINGTMPATFTATKWGSPRGITLTDKQFNSYVEISADDNSANRGFPLIGSVFASGNGVNWTEESGCKPEVEYALLEIDGGSTLRAFGGGNMATVTKDTYIFTNAKSTNFANVEFAGYQTNIMKKIFFGDVKTGFKWDGNRLIMDPFHVESLFGGNNLATMDIQPTWNLKKGRLENVYSGGNMGDMTYYNPDGKPATENGLVGGVSGAVATDGSNANLKPRGLSITIDQPEIFIGSLFGGCRLSDVNPTPKAGQAPWPEGNNGEDYYGATVNITDGYIDNVYGGNDISGTVHYGTNVNISGAVSGNVYGSGNGFYLYKYDEEVDHVTEDMDDEHGIFYRVPVRNKNGELIDNKGQAGTDTHKILTINNHRPFVEKAFLNIGGLEHYPAGESNPKRVAYVKGSVFCGGNASTVRGEESFTKFKIGSYVTLNGVFMGCDGLAYTDNEHIAQFADLNDIQDMGGKTSFNSGYELDAEHNPILLNAFMMAVDMESQPKDFNLNLPLKEAHIGTYCGGGNRGSMLVDETVTLPFHHDIIIYDKIVAACLDANVKYNQNGTIITSNGGYTRAIKNPETAPHGNTKMYLDIASQFVPLVMDVPADKDPNTLNAHNENFAAAAEHDFLYDNRTVGENAQGLYASSCNIYAGCYQSGEVVGNVVLNLHSNMLRYVNKESLDRTNAENIACFNVYGAGFGQDSHVWGNVKINMDRSLNESMMGVIGSSTLSDALKEKLGGTESWNIQNQQYQSVTPQLDCSYPSFNNVFGGGRNGKLIGNSQIEIRNGLVFSDVVGGSYASDMYGSSHVIVGYPKYYKCNTSGEYNVKRGDEWNTGKKDFYGDDVIKQKVQYLKGDLVPENMYKQIMAYDASQAGSFSEEEVTPTTNGTTWDDVFIKIGKGVYGGGYSLANSTAASAGVITLHKLQTTQPEDAIYPLNFNGRYGYDDNTVGYGGNSSIMIGDQDGDTRDHIRISTLIAKPVTVPAGSTVLGKFVKESDGSYTHQGDVEPVAGTQYYEVTGDGGVYGDGHLTFCEGFRAADITRYGWADGTLQHPILMNTFQRIDLLSVNDCCLMLQGAQDFATDQIDATTYSITRVNELRMNSSLNANSKLDAKRNYLAFFNNVHYLGALVTNDAFTADFHDNKGNCESTTTYQAKKQKYIADYSDVINNPSSTQDKKHDAELEFKKRNIGTARNAIGVNNGLCVRIQNQEYIGEAPSRTAEQYYGPIVGVCEVKLLSITKGEGGGYVYADNIHADENNFLNTSGNFVFEGIIGTGDDGDQYIIDDCFLKHFGTQDNITKKSGELDEAHYWYVEGNKYYFNTTLTAFTYQDPMTFNLRDNDPNIILSGMKEGSKLNLKKVEWLSQHRTGYDAVLPNTTPGKVDDYEFDLEVGGNTTDNWTSDMPRYTSGSAESPLTTDLTTRNDNIPQFNIRLQDNPDNSGDANYINHLDEPELVKIYLEGETDGQKYEYTITLNVVYLQGPTFEGGVSIDNCALPGEWIGFSSKGLKVKTVDVMPITAASWQIVPLKEIDQHGVWHWDIDNGTDIPAANYSEDVDGNLSGHIPALYCQNEHNIAYVFTAGNKKFQVLPKQQDDIAKENRMIVVHNYHRMKDVVSQNLHIETMPVVPNHSQGSETVSHPAYPEAKLYIEDEQDLRAFINYLNISTSGNHDNIPVGLYGLDIILQDDIILTAELPAITQSFDGTFHGDGYHISLGNYASTLFGDKLTGKVYNLGIIGGTISSADTKAANGIVNGTHTVNSYEYAASDDFAYGRIAYQLSHAFTPDTDTDNYVARYYADGDYQYATANRVWSLRTGAPHYGRPETHHDMAHPHDAARWNDQENTNIPLYDGTLEIDNRVVNLDNGSDQITYHGIPVGYADDYLFFGQHLDINDADTYPMHISPVATGDADKQKGGNRVYETAGYYRSAADQKFCYNKDAWALSPALTAIDFTHPTLEGDKAVTTPTAFSVDSNIHYDTVSDLPSHHVTQNLLVYNNGETIFDYSDSNDSDESTVLYHNIVKDGSDKYSTDYMHLVDKQEFFAPIVFDVTERAWYERTPAHCAETDNSAWEGICLPFTVNKVMASTNGEITHFYGMPTDAQLADPATNDKTLHHEYWLRGLVSVTSPEGQTIATFQRPGDASPLFATQAQTAAAFNYAYAANSFFKDNRPNYNNDDNPWYDSEHTYEGYNPLTANTPYIITFPGERFYEFDLTEQKITYNNYGGTTVPETAAMTTVADGYSHNGTFLYVSDAVYGINGEGTAFDGDMNEVLPFRTYLTAETSPAKSLIYIGASRAAADAFDMMNPDPGIGSIMPGNYLNIHAKGKTIIIESSEEHILPCHGISGTLVGMWRIQRGINVFDNLRTGIYVIGGKKLVIK